MIRRFSMLFLLLGLLLTATAEEKKAKSRAAKDCCSAAIQLAAPQLGNLGLNGGAVNVVLSSDNTTAYACGPNQVSVIDISDPTSMRLLSSTGAANFGGLAVSGCFQAGQSLVVPLNKQSGFVYDISSSRNLRQQSQFTPPFPYNGHMSSLGTTGLFTTDWLEYNTSNNVIFAQHGEYAAVDFSNPASPTTLGSLAPVSSQPASSNLSPRFASVNNGSDTAYIFSTTATGGDPNGGQGAIHIIDISNLSAMAATGIVLVPQATVMTAGAIQDNILLVAGNTKGWRNPGTRNGALNFQFTGVLTLSALDVTDPRNPAVISSRCSSIATWQGLSSSVQPLGSGFFALSVGPPPDEAVAFGADGRGQLMLVDARDPQNLSLISLGYVPKLAGIAVRGGILYAATGDGLLTFQLPDLSGL